MLAGKLTPEDANLAQVGNGKTRDIVAKRTGKARTSLAKAEALVAAAEAEPDNKNIAALVQRMDSHRQRQRAVQAPEGHASGRGDQGRTAAAADERSLSGDRRRPAVAL